MRPTLFVATGLVAAAVASSAMAADLVRVGLAVPNNAAYAPGYAAQELGYYKDAGIEVEFTIYRGGAASQEALSTGAADVITYFGAGAGLAISKGAKEKIVATIGAKPHGWYMLVLKDSDIQKPADLAGRKVGVATKAGTADMFALWAADRAGVEIQTIPVGGGGMVPALKGEQVEAIAMFPGLSLKLLHDGTARSIVDLAAEMEPSLPDVWVASDEMMQEHPERLKAFLSGFYKGLQHMRDDRAWGLNFLKEFTREKDDATNEAVYDAVTMKQSSDGHLEATWVKNSLDIAAEAWGMPALAKLDPDTLFTNAYNPSGS